MCAPSQPTCNSTVATTCTATGLEYVAGGTDCAKTKQACKAGACVAGPVCAAEGYFCEVTAVAETVRYCYPGGMTSSLAALCGANEYCDASTTIPTCKTRP